MNHRLLSFILSFFFAGADDGHTKLWDARQRTPVASLTSRFQVTAVALSADAKTVYSGGLDGEVKVWDIRKDEIAYSLEGHGNVITGISLSPDGGHLLSNSMDKTLKMWDVRNFVAGERCAKTFVGIEHNFEKWLLKCRCVRLAPVPSSPPPVTVHFAHAPSLSRPRSLLTQLVALWRAHRRWKQRRHAQHLGCANRCADVQAARA